MPSIKDIVAGQSVGVGKRIIKSGADKLRGIINERTGGGMPSFGAFGMTKLTYPLDVVDDAQQGHYIVFTVRTKTKPAEVDDSGAEDKKNPVAITNQLAKKDNAFGKAILKKLMGGASGGNIVSELKSKATTIAEQKVENYTEAFKDANINKEGIGAIDAGRGHADSGSDKLGKARFSLRQPTYRTNTMITLYMPPQVKNITGVTYKDQEIGVMSTIVGSFLEGLTDEDRHALKDLDTEGVGLKQALRGAGNMLGMEAQELFTLATGKLISPRMEFIFDAVKKRVFTYQFSFYPKSEQEAMEVEKIIQTFRKNMLPSKIDGAQQDILALNVPNEFNIEYYYKGNQNNFINKVGTCLLTDCDITYGGDRYGTFKPGETRDGLPGASPTETHMTVTFQEMDIITQEDIDEGF